MTTKEFINFLAQNETLPLRFEYTKDRLVRKDYHITEIKNVNFDTVDCGGVRNQWQEVHVQLWENSVPEPWHQVNAAKALKIFQSVARVRDTYDEVEIKFEYGNDTFHTALLPVRAVIVQNKQLVVQLDAQKTTCKAKDQLIDVVATKVASCCSPSCCT